MSMSKFNVVINQKNGKTAIHEGYDYNFNKTSADKKKIYWRCTQYYVTRCPGRMTTVGENVEKVLEHSHSADVRSGEVRKVLQNIRMQAVVSNDPPRRIIRKNTWLADAVSAVELPSNPALTRTISRVRKKNRGYQKEPSSLQELVLTAEQMNTLKGDKFVLYDNNDPVKRIIIFTTHANLTILVHSDLWGMDGTFDVTPPLFDQLYTIHGRYHRKFLPLVYVLTCGRDFVSYDIIFSQLLTAEPRLAPKYIMVDFEKAAIKAAKAVFPNANVTGCYFHFCQCIFRQVQQNGLQTLYATDANFAQHIRCLAALAIVPTDNVFDHYQALMKFAFFQDKLNGKTDVDIGVQKLLSYMEHTWIGRIVRKKYVSGTFALDLWNVYEITLQLAMRTNNAIEAWHNAIGIYFGISHPSIFKFIDGIKEEQDGTEIIISKIMAGLPVVVQNKKHEQLAERIVNVVRSYANPEEFQLKQYLFGISSAIHFPVSKKISV